MDRRAHLSNNNSSIFLGEHDRPSSDREASCLFALITGRRSVSRRNRASWYLRQLNKSVKCDTLDLIEQDGAPPQAAQRDQDQDQDEVSQQQRQKQQQTDRHSPLPKTDDRDIFLVSVVSSHQTTGNASNQSTDQESASQTPASDERFLVTPSTKVIYLSKSVSTSIILDLSPSVVSVSPQDNCVFLDSMFDALKRILHLLVKEHEFPSSQACRQFTLAPKVFVSVIAYTPFVVAKNNQVLIQNRRISSLNIDQVLVELWICLIRLIQELHDLVTNTCGINYEYETSKTSSSAFVFAPPLTSSIIRHPGSVLDDIYELGLFSASLMPRLTRLSVIVITDGLFASSNDLSAFRLRSIAVSFVSLANELIYPDACFGYTTYSDLMKFVAKSTQGIYIPHSELIASSCNLSRTKQIPLMSNPLFKIFGWSLHCDIKIENQCITPAESSDSSKIPPSPTSLVPPVTDMRPENIARLFCIDQPVDTFQQATSTSNDRSIDMDLATNQNYHDWRSFKQLSKNLDADFEQVLACLLREGYLIKSIQLKGRETSNICARLVLYWKHNLNLEQELTAPYWNSADPFEMSDSSNLILKPFLAPSYGDTFCEVIVHGSYNFLHDFYCDKKVKRRSDYRSIAYQQYEQLVIGVKHTYDRLQYLSRYYRDSNLSRVPAFLQHGNSLLFEQPHTHNLISTIENLVDKTPQSRAFSDYWQEVSHIELRNWKNLMHVHTLRLILEHDQPKHKNLFCQNANGRYTHIQCRRAMSAMSNFIKGYASFALLEDSLYIKFIHTKEDDLREIETSATKGFIVIRIKKLLPIVVVYLMFTSGILDSHRVQIVDYIEQELITCKLREARISIASQSANGVQSRASTSQSENILKSKIIYAPNEACCTLVKSPLERMLRVYSRNMIAEFLSQNLTHGLPGSCPYSIQHRTSALSRQHQQKHHRNDDTTASSQQQHHQQHKSRAASMRDQLDDCSIDNNNAHASNRYNPVFGKYLYGIRVIHTLGGLPYSLVHQMVMNVLAKISAILVNVRIKQGFHIAFNNSGLLTLVTELAMKDYSHEYHSSNCLCQYLVFPPTITNSGSHSASILAHGNSVGINNGGTSATQVNPSSTTGIVGSVGSLSGSLANSDQSYMRNANDISSPTIQGYDNQGEIKVIREYWIEQQYGISASSSDYHKSLENMRYSEVVDHLYLTDKTIFDCLLTYDLLQLFCDRMSPFYELDVALAQSESRNTSLYSPTDSTTSSNILDTQISPTTPSLPSNLLEGTTKDASSRVPLIELDYKFSLVDFLDYCQYASLDVLLFKNESAFYEPASVDLDASKMDTSGRSGKSVSASENTSKQEQVSQSLSKGSLRKTSVDINTMDSDIARREHRSSYDSINTMSMTQAYTSTILNPSLNHLFLETLHKRLKQIHDKELRVSELDRRKMTEYLKRRKMKLDAENDSRYEDVMNGSPLDSNHMDQRDTAQGGGHAVNGATIHESSKPNWRCFMRKGNQENLMIVLIPASLDDVKKWMLSVEGSPIDGEKSNYEHEVCPIFVFRCSSTMINDQVLAFLHETSESKKTEDPGCSPSRGRSNLETDLSLHFGQPCRYINKLRALNDELDNEILPLNKFSELSQGISDEKTLELVHFRAFLRKIKNTVLKSRFSSLNDAYLSELFVHKNDILYYINNVDMDTQKKYHVSSHLRGLADFIRAYEEYHDALPREPTKPCNQLLNSILLQKCGLYINQPLARFDEANPLMKHLHDRKLLALMRRNYKIELPILEENLSNSTFLKKYLSPAPPSGRLPATQVNMIAQRQRDQPISMKAASPSSSTISSSAINEAKICGPLGSSLGRATGSSSRLLEMNYGSIGNTNLAASNSPVGSAVGYSSQGHHHHHRQDRPPRMMPRLNSQLSDINLTFSPSNDSFFLEAFKNSSCSIEEILASYLDDRTLDDVSLRHEAHMAEVLKRKGERKESHHYRRVLKSKANYNQSHSAIDQALKRVDSLGRLEHFCLTPLLFSPAWRSKLAPVRDHTIESTPSYQRAQCNDSDSTKSLLGHDGDEQQQQQQQQQTSSSLSMSSSLASQQEEANERWHQMICNNYIKEYEQYIQTLGFNSVQIRYPSSSRLQTSMSSSGFGSSTGAQTFKMSSGGPTRKTSLQTLSPSQSSLKNVGRKAGTTTTHLRRDSSANSSTASNSFIPISSTTSSNLPSNLPVNSNYNTGYLIKFLNSGCLVFKVGFCKPYVYSILYSIEGERFNNSNLKMNMTAFLDELDNIKVTLHLHSFTYDYHLRSMYSYISRRQINFNPGYHLISFVDDFRKYYQKSPNYARNHILSGDVSVTNLKVDGQQLYNYIVTHNTTYQLDVLEMTSSNVANLIANFNAASSNMNNHPRSASQQFASFLSASFGSKQDDDQQQQHSQDSGLSGRNHANDYVLIELEREKVRYKDGKDPDIFDCGLLIAHDLQQTRASKNCLVLKYFLILTNQRDLYPKLYHANDSIISLGCHRPIRLGLVDHQVASATVAVKLPSIKTTSSSAVKDITTATVPRAIDRAAQNTASSVATNPTDLDADLQSASELLSSGELSGPQSIISTVNSVQSTSSIGCGPNSLINNPHPQLVGGGAGSVAISDTEASVTSSVRVIAPSSLIERSSLLRTEEAAEVLASEDSVRSQDKSLGTGGGDNSSQDFKLNSIEYQQHSSSASVATTNGGEVDDSIDGGSVNRESSCSPTLLGDSNRASCKSTTTREEQRGREPQERTICDEEITYLGYFSSDEMDMLKFLQEKTTRLKSHLEEIVKQAEVHFRRDYLWHKLMQRQLPSDQGSSIMSSRSSSAAAAAAADQMPLAVEELIQLMAIVEAIDLATLDQILYTFTTMHITWYLKLLKAFNDLKQSPQGCVHRIYTVKASKILLLFIDPKCTSAFVLLSVDSDRGSVEMSLILKDKQECFSSDMTSSSRFHMRAGRNHKGHNQSTSPKGGSDINSVGSPALIDLDVDCQQIISDFINFCATFMWSNLLT